MSEPNLIIVEDDETFARALQRSFERRGYRVRTAADPAEPSLLSGPIHAWALEPEYVHRTANPLQADGERVFEHLRPQR